MKRLVDLAGALFGLLLLMPLFLILAVWIKLDSPGSVFYRQERVGRHGKPFRIWKFRTMVREADQSGPPLTVGADVRITRVGRWLRTLKLDELPQLFNVISGEMSLVGPRPEVPRYVERYTESQREVLDHTPGITDPASIEYRNESAMLAESEDPEAMYVDEVLPRKIGINLDYQRSATVGSDIRIILRTFGRILRRDSANRPAPNQEATEGR